MTCITFSIDNRSEPFVVRSAMLLAPWPSFCNYAWVILKPCVLPAVQRAVCGLAAPEPVRSGDVRQPLLAPAPGPSQRGEAKQSPSHVCAHSCIVPPTLVCLTMWTTCVCMLSLQFADDGNFSRRPAYPLTDLARDSLEFTASSLVSRDLIPIIILPSPGPPPALLLPPPPPRPARGPLRVLLPLAAGGRPLRGGRVLRGVPLPRPPGHPGQVRIGRGAWGCRVYN